MSKESALKNAKEEELQTRLSKCLKPDVGLFTVNDEAVASTCCTMIDSLYATSHSGVWCTYSQLLESVMFFRLLKKRGVQRMQRRRPKNFSGDELDLTPKHYLIFSESPTTSINEQLSLMRPTCLVTSRTLVLRQAAWTQRRSLLTLAIETSCDDTSVAVLEKQNQKSTLHFHSKVTSENRAFQGVHPLVALESHQKNLAALVNSAVESLPIQRSEVAHFGNTLLVDHGRGAQLRKKPHFVTVTRGPGMRANLNTGLDTAKGLAVAWQVPLLGVNHMQAHALTPRLVSSLEAGDESQGLEPAFPFVSLLVSGGHTMLVHSRGLCDHQILAKTSDIAIGNVIDKCARDILPASALGIAGSLTYGRLLEDFAFPRGSDDYGYLAPATRGEEIRVKDAGYGWSFTPPLSQTRAGAKDSLMEFSYSGIGSTVKRVMSSEEEVPDIERRVLAQETLRVAFEHLASRLLMALKRQEMKTVDTVVVSGGVASNRYLKHVLRTNLDMRGFEHIRLTFPPPSLCTDNAAMIGWTGLEMWENGWRSNLDISSLREWAIDGADKDDGLLGADGWTSIQNGLEGVSARRAAQPLGSTG